MEGLIINIITTAPFSVGFLAIFFFIYYFCLKGNVGDIREEDKDKRLSKRIMK